MKNLFKTLLCLSLLLGYSATDSQARTAPKGYYWVVEVSTTDTPSSTFRIYHQHDQLVYEETIKDKSLDISKRSIRRKLDKAMRTYVASAQQLTKHSRTNLLQSLAVR